MLAATAILVGSVVPASADFDEPKVSSGDHFSKRYQAVFGGYKPYRWASEERLTYRIRQGNKTILTRSKPGTGGLTTMLAPGHYTATRQYFLRPADTATLRDLVDWESVKCVPDEVSSRRVGREEYIHAQLQCGTDEGYVYKGAREWRGLGPKGDPGIAEGELLTRSRYWSPRYLIPNIEMTRIDSEPPTRWVESVRFQVRGRNGEDITGREAKAIRIGMTKGEVRRILGNGGTEKIQGAGIEVRNYDGQLVIGYVNGRVNSIQR